MKFSIPAAFNLRPYRQEHRQLQHCTAIQLPKCRNSVFGIHRRWEQSTTMSALVPLLPPHLLHGENLNYRLLHIRHKPRSYMNTVHVLTHTTPIVNMNAFGRLPDKLQFQDAMLQFAGSTVKVQSSDLFFTCIVSTTTTFLPPPVFVARFLIKVRTVGTWLFHGAGHCR